MKMKALRLAIVCALLVPAVPYGNTPPSAAELREYCLAFDAEPESKAGRLCVSYVRGFVDGLIASEASVTPSASESESWVERAARTRLGPRYQPSVISAACLDDPAAMREFIARVLARLQASSPKDESAARDLVLSVLREHSPCSE